MTPKNSPPQYSPKIREEELKNYIARDWFPAQDFDTARIIGNIDFSVAVLDEGKMTPETQFLLWAEAKAGNTKDICISFIQLILTIGKARTFDQFLPPHFLGAFDAEKIAFIPYSAVMHIFSQNDFNWNVTPSDHETKEFKQLLTIIRTTLEEDALLFNFSADAEELSDFIRDNFRDAAVGLTKIPVDKNNFTAVYQKWLDKVKPSIAANWEKAKAKGILDADFYLADLLSSENISIKESLYVLLKSNHYEFDRIIDDSGFEAVINAKFKDSQKAHTQFWNLYSRPPKEEFWQYILDRRDILVSPDVRERKGSFYTPRQWVELSQQYLADVLGEDWQAEYYIWDCCAGTGNLLVGLTEKYRIWASTLDKADVSVMQDIAKTNKNLLESHIFQFDFLNDSFEKLPEGLKKIINDPEKRKKLLLYINPPYAEAASCKTIAGTGENKKDVAVKMKEYSTTKDAAGIAGRELFVQFLMRIYREIPGAFIGNFSKTKILQSPNFKEFRNVFSAKLEKLFVMPADTFDNVTGQFPIGFFIWNTQKQKIFSSITAAVYTNQFKKDGKRKIISYSNKKSINDWIITTRNRNEEQKIGYMSAKGADFQNANYVYIVNDKSQLPHPRGTWVTDCNLIEIAVYMAVRKIPAQTWLNAYDQFCFPNKTWEHDEEFKTNCLCWTLFNNNIQYSKGINYWIPFTETEIDADDSFESRFMTDFISGKIKQNDSESLLSVKSSIPSVPLIFSEEAKAVFEAGKALYKYYHSMPNSDPNAGLYDIKKYFQGINDKGRMNASAKDEKYTELLSELRTALKSLEQKIEPKIYEHGFLKK